MLLLRLYMLASFGYAKMKNEKEAKSAKKHKNQAQDSFFIRRNCTPDRVPNSYRRATGHFRLALSSEKKLFIVLIVSYCVPPFNHCKLEHSTQAAWRRMRNTPIP